MRRNNILIYTLILVSFITIYCQIAPIKSNDNIWHRLESGLGLLPNTSFTLIFIIQAFLLKYPFKRLAKLIFFIEGVYIFFSGTFISLIWIAYSRNETYPHFAIFVSYILISNFFISIWTLLLITPLSKLKLVNWPFEKREGHTFTKKSNKKPYIAKSVKKPSNR